MNKKFFDRHLMSEAMRQVRLPGLIGVLLLVGVSFFMVFIEAINLGYSSSTSVNYDFQDVNIYIMLVMYTFAPLMVMMLFGFMNRRRASDFYHSLAFTRTCIYISYMAAVLLWCIIIIAAGSITTLIVASLSGRMHISLTSALRSMADAAAGVVLTMSVMAFAMTLTGTYLTNVITALLFLFAPRGIVALCGMLLKNAMPFAVFSGNSILGSACNIPFDFLAGAARVMSFRGGSIYSSWIPAVYTIVLGLIYSIAGAACFAKRKSENATMASVNRGLQCFLRIIPAVLISFVSISTLFNVHTSGHGISRSDLFIVIMAYLAAVVVYFLYEIITTRRVANLLKAIPGLGIVIVINLVLYFGLNFSYDYHIAQLPEKQELEYVVVHGPEDSLLWKDTMDVKLYSEEARAVTSDSLKDTVNLWMYNKNGIDGFYNQYYTGNCMIVEYHYTSGKSILRKVIVNETRYGQLKKALVDESGFAQSFGRSVFDMENMEYSVGDLSSDASKEVYDIFLAEIKNKGTAKLFEIINERNLYKNFLFQISLWDKSGRRYSTIYIGTDMPLTAVAYMNALNKECPGNECEKFVESVDRIKNNEFNSTIDNNGSYLDANLFFDMYTVRPDGSLSEVDSYSSAYYDLSYYNMPSEEGLENIAKLGMLTRVSDIKLSDLEPGTILLQANYYESSTVTTYDDYGGVSSCTTSVDNDWDYGWYIIDSFAEELVKQISMDIPESYEQ